MNIFKFIGKITDIKEKENFKTVNTKRYDSGWTSKKTNHTITCNGNMITINAEGSVFTDISDGKMSFSTAEKNKIYLRVNGDDGTENISIPFSQRNDKEIIDKAIFSSKYIVDTNMPYEIENLEKFIDKLKEGTASEEEKKQFGCNTVQEAESLIAVKKTYRKEFISTWDFTTEYIKALKAYPNAKWLVTGNYNVTYNTEKKQAYANYVVTRLQRVADDEKEVAEVSLDVVFDKNALVLDNWKQSEDKIPTVSGEAVVKGYTPFYYSDKSGIKGTFFTDIEVVIDGNVSGLNEAGKDKNRIAYGLKRQFEPSNDSDESPYRKIGINCDVISKASKVDITEDMLSEEQKLNIELGITTLEEIAKESGKEIKGEFQRRFVVKGLKRGYSSGSQETKYTSNDIVPPCRKESEIDDMFAGIDDI